MSVLRSGATPVFEGLPQRMEKNYQRRRYRPAGHLHAPNPLAMAKIVKRCEIKASRKKGTPKSSQAVKKPELRLLKAKKRKLADQRRRKPAKNFKKRQKGPEMVTTGYQQRRPYPEARRYSIGYVCTLKLVRFSASPHSALTLPSAAQACWARPARSALLRVRTDPLRTVRQQAACPVLKSTILSPAFAAGVSVRVAADRIERRLIGQCSLIIG